MALMFCYIEYDPFPGPFWSKDFFKKTTYRRKYETLTVYENIPVFRKTSYTVSKNDDTGEFRMRMHSRIIFDLDDWRHYDISSQLIKSQDIPDAKRQELIEKYNRYASGDLPK